MKIIRESIMSEMDSTAQQDLSRPIPIDDLQFVDEEGYGAMMFPGAGHSYSVREQNFEAVARKFGGGPVPMDPAAAALQSLMLLKAAGYRTVTDEDEEEGPMPIDDQIEFLRDVASGNAGY